MPKKTLYLGLTYFAIAGLFLIISGFRSFTPLIPTIPGTLFIILGLLANKEALRKHLIHGAVVLSAICSFMIIMGMRRLLPLLSGGEINRPLAAFEMLIAGIFALIYTINAVRSFISVRAAKKS